jgi:hypothetical protein
MGDWIRLNRQGAQPEEILTVRSNIVMTYRGNLYRVTKIVHADPAARYDTTRSIDGVVHRHLSVYLWRCDQPR